MYKPILILIVTALCYYGILKYTKENAPQNAGRSEPVKQGKPGQAASEVARVAKMGAGFSESKDINQEKAKPQKVMQITMYAKPEEEYKIKAVEMLLELSGKSFDVVNVSGVDELAEMEMLPVLKKERLTYYVRGELEVPLPFFRVNGKYCSEGNFLALLPKIPKSKLLESKSRYISVYAPEDCDTTTFRDCNAATNLQRKLEEDDLPANFRDISDVDNRARVTMLMWLGYQGSLIDWPVVDVNGHILVNPNLDEIRALYVKKKIPVRKYAKREVVFE